MKPKPLSHKSQNTFKFQTFSQQIAQINVNVSRLIGATRSGPQDADTFFNEALLKWNELNCTEHFGQFKNELNADYEILPQLVINKDAIVQCIKKHLNVPHSLAYPPLLELVVALARDLQNDFYFYFFEFLEIFNELLSSKDVEVIECVFRTIAYLFKILWQYMINDFQRIYSSYSCLLDDNRPHYVKAFASESIAFLLRKFPSRDVMLKTIFISLENNLGLCEGVGHLLFEAVKNVQNRFHSCFEDIFYKVLSRMGIALSFKEQLPWEEVLKCSSVMITLLLKHTTPEFSPIIWKIFYKVLWELKVTFSTSEQCLKERQYAIDHLERILNLLNVCISFKDGWLCHLSTMSDEELVDLVVNLGVSDPKILEKCGDHIANIVKFTILSPNVNLPTLTKAKIIITAFNSKLKWTIKWNITKDLFTYAAFHMEVLPHYFYMCDEMLAGDITEEKNAILSTMAELIIYFRPSFLSEGQLELNISNDIFNFADKRHFNGGEKGFLKYLEAILKLQDKNDFWQDRNVFPSLWAAVVCIAHIRISCHSLLSEHLTDLRTKLHNVIICKKANDDITFLYFCVISTMVTTNSVDMGETVTINEMINLLKRNSSNIHCLKIVDLYIAFMKRQGCKECYDEDVAKRILPLIEKNLSSPHDEIRSISLKIFSRFDFIFPQAASESHFILFDNDTRAEDHDFLKDVQAKKIVTVFDVCLQAENTSLTMLNFRERIRILQYLEYNQIKSNIPSGGFENLPLQYLIGTLHVPFEPLWEPTVTLIDSYAKGMEKNMFWKCFVQYLNESAVSAERNLLENPDDQYVHSVESVTYQLFKQYRLNFGKLSTRVDCVNHRKLLWKSMLHFVDIAESNSQDLSNLLLNFMKNEFYRVQLEDAFSQNVKGCVTENILQTNDEDITEIEENLSFSEDSKSALFSSKSIYTILCAHLSVFSKFKNPNLVRQETKLKEVYFALLTHPDTAIQKSAFNCIASYNHDYLRHYKDNLFRLMDMKTFKSELILFNIESTASVVQEVHRSSLMPYLIRILYGIMQKKQGIGNSSANLDFQVRRNLILQYLANSEEEEFKIFLDLIFNPFRPFINGDILVLVENVFVDFNVCDVIPLKKMEGFYHLIETIFKKFGGRILTHLPWIFKLLICVTARVTALSENQDQIHPKFLRHLKLLKKLALIKIIQFFTTFEDYPYSREEIDALFMSCIWHQLKRLPRDGIRVRTYVLQLLFHWSENSRFFPLLSKHYKDNRNLNPLNQIMQLLSNKSTDPTVVAMIFELIKNLVTLSDFTPNSIESEDSEATGPEIEINDALPVSNYIKRNEDEKENQNFGCLILLPHIAPILQRLQHSIDVMGKGPKTVIPEANFTILNRLSEFIDDGKFCSTLIKMLIPFLTKKLYRNEEFEVNLFSTITRLLKFADEPLQFVNPLAVLFSSLENRCSRLALCEAFKVITAKNAENFKCSSLAVKLNSWDAKRPEEVDYSSRIDGFQEAASSLDFDPANSSYLLVVLYNCCYMIRSVNDLAIRDNASYCLQKLASTLQSVSKADVGNVSKTFLLPVLTEVKRGIRNKNEPVRHEFISVLAAFTRECCNFPGLNDLRQLTNLEVDVDFFENIKHIQMHRRSRAMSKLTNGDLLQRLNQTTLTHYVMPIISTFLFNDSYAKLNFLVDATIALVGKICSHLNWKLYTRFLRLYVAKIMENTKYQKTAVSLVVSILNGFHFDLSVIENYPSDNLVTPPIRIPVVETDDIAESGDEIDDDLEISQNLDESNKTSSENAMKIYESVTRIILPQLHNCITRKAARDDDHRLAHSFNSDEDETLRVPIAIAMVKLLQRLPKGMLDVHLPGILMKLCTFLKSRLESVRRVARETLITITESLGEKYLPYVIKEMRQLLTRGYQVHSMTFTIHALLRHLKPHLKHGSLDQCVSSIIKVYNEELFGIVAEEKEIQQIVGKLVEAKGIKAYDVYEILANFVSYSCLDDLVSALKEVLTETTNHVIVSKVNECLRRITLGLDHNDGLTYKNILVFSYGIVKNGLQDNKYKAVQKCEQNTVFERPNLLIIPEEPRRNKIVIHKSPRTNLHALTNFGLQVLYFALKRGKIEIASKEALEMLDPFIELIHEYLSSQHAELITSSLKALMWLLKLELPSLKKFMNRITKALFKILKTYSGGNRLGVAANVIGTCFKTIIVLIRYVSCANIEVDHLKVLLIYVERNVNDSSKQALAFNMLKAILSKKLLVPEIHDIITNICKMSIISEIEHVRTNCRQCALIYLLDYPLGNKIDIHLQFFISQLKYEHECGRESAIEMLNTICSVFPQKILDSNAPSFLVALSFSMANDESATCRKMVSLVIKVLISKVSENSKNMLFTIVEAWMTDKKISVRKLGNQLCGLFAEVEKDTFMPRVAVVLPLMSQDILLSKLQETDDQNTFDHLFIQILTTFLKVLTACNFIRLAEYQDEVNKLWDCFHGLLLHPHTWIKLLSCQLFGILFAAYPIDEAMTIVASSQESKCYLFKDFSNNLLSLANKFCKQLKSAAGTSELNDQIAKNMVYLIELVSRSPVERLSVEVPCKRRNNDDMETSKIITLSTSWLIKKFIKEVKDEVTNETKIIHRRSCFFHLVAAISLKLGKDQLIKNLTFILPPLLREMTVDSRYRDDSLKTLAQEVIDVIKEKIGLDVFSRHYAQVQHNTSERKVKRKTDRAAQAVVNPQIAAKRKIKKNISKTEHKKRKIDYFQKGRPAKLGKL